MIHRHPTTLGNPPKSRNIRRSADGNRTKRAELSGKCKRQEWHQVCRTKIRGEMPRILFSAVDELGRDSLAQEIRIGYDPIALALRVQLRVGKRSAIEARFDEPHIPF